MEDLTFQIKRYVVQLGFQLKGIQLQPEQIILEELTKGCRILFDLATQEQPVHDYPADWWQALKARWFPRCALRWWPVRETHVIAVHKFPEVKVPYNIVGREFMHMHTIKPKGEV